MLCGNGLKRIFLISLVLSVLSLVPLHSSALDELTEILNSYETITKDLSQKSTNLENRLDNLVLSIETAETNSKNLTAILRQQSEQLKLQESNLMKVEEDLIDSQKQIVDLQISYKDMEQSLTAWRLVAIAATAVSLYAIFK